MQNKSPEISENYKGVWYAHWGGQDMHFIWHIVSVNTECYGDGENNWWLDF